MEFLEEIVQTSKSALDASAHRHLVLPAVTHGLQGDRVDMVGYEATVRAGGVT